jgi:hypothetical protein
MTGLDLLAVGVVGVFLVSTIVFAVVGRRAEVTLRHLPAFEQLGVAIERAVEAGERVHLSLGTGALVAPEGAPALAGLSLLSHVATTTTMSDKPAVITAGSGPLAILAQDSLATAYRHVGWGDRVPAGGARLLGATPFSYVAGLPGLLDWEDISVHMLIGSFGLESGLASDFGTRQRAFVLAGTEDLQSQALFYATAEHSLIGEEVFAGGAYLNVGNLHRAGLRAQDLVRDALMVGLVLGTILATLGVLR